MAAKHLVTELKADVLAILKANYPDTYKQFKLTCRRWSTGGSIDIQWFDGPSEKAVDALFTKFRASCGIIFGLHRRYSKGFVAHVAQEYCSCKGCEMPEINVMSDGSAWMDNNYSKDIPYRATFEEMRKLDEKDLETLAYRLHMINDVMTPVRTWIVRRRDYSHGKYPHLAIAREKSYTSYKRKIFDVRKRINDNWVYVVEGTSRRHIHSIYELDAHVEACKSYGWKY